MERTKGLKEYIQTKEYRESLGLSGQVTETYTMLAQGEYNRNYTFTHPITGQKLVLRINFGSQMHLKDQILYEYRALKLLETPAYAKSYLCRRKLQKSSLWCYGHGISART